jgi:hypothetical protein
VHQPWHPKKCPAPPQGDLATTELARLDGEWVLVAFVDGEFAGTYRSPGFVAERKVGCDWKESDDGPTNPDAPDAYRAVDVREWKLTTEQRAAILGAFQQPAAKPGAR